MSEDVSRGASFAVDAGTPTRCACHFDEKELAVLTGQISSHKCVRFARKTTKRQRLPVKQEGEGVRSAQEWLREARIAGFGKVLRDTCNQSDTGQTYRAGHCQFARAWPGGNDVLSKNAESNFSSYRSGFCHRPCCLTAAGGGSGLHQRTTDHPGDRSGRAARATSFFGMALAGGLSVLVDLIIVPILHSYRMLGVLPAGLIGGVLVASGLLSLSVAVKTDGFFLGLTLLSLGTALFKSNFNTIVMGVAKQVNSRSTAHHHPP